uniref:BTB domain-containing protein n=1 Tax=Chrysemys picta bellii TaxID=8478 RepID=A0A8C3FFV5_CHRPI
PSGLLPFLGLAPGPAGCLARDSDPAPLGSGSRVSHTPRRQPLDFWSWAAAGFLSDELCCLQQGPPPRGLSLPPHLWPCSLPFPPALCKALSKIVTRRPGEAWLRLNLAGSLCHTLRPAPSRLPRSPPQAMAYAGSAVLEGDAAAFAAAVRSLINNPQFSDVTFVVGRERQEVFAHRCILACRCQAFQGMFSQPQPDAQEPWAPPDPIGPQPCAARGLPGRSRVPVHQQRDPQQLRGECCVLPRGRALWEGQG